MIDYFLFDLDGTVTNEEILPLISKALDIEQEISELTRLTIDGVIPFEYSFRHRVNILKQVPISKVREIVSRVELNVQIVDFIKERPNKCAIITGNLDVWLTDLIRRLGVPVFCSRARCHGDHILDIDSVIDKGATLAEFQGRRCAIGDGHSDIEMLASAEIGIAYGGVHSPARALFDVASHVVYNGDTLCRLLLRL